MLADSLPSTPDPTALSSIDHDSPVRATTMLRISENLGVYNLE